jgi:transcription elongation factor Elf1
MLSVDSKYIRLVAFRLRNFKQKKDYLWNFSCPICGDSKKNKLKARGYIFQKGTDLFYTCHNCGVGLSLGNFLKHIDSTTHKEYVLERYTSGKSNNSSVANTVLNISPPKFDKVEKQKTFEHSEWCDKLPSGHYCLEYLKHRKIPEQYYKSLLFTQHYKQFIDVLVPNHGKQLVDDARLVIPFYNEYNDLIAVSGRALETSDKTLRYITIRTVESDKKLLFGMDRISVNEPVKIVEGPIDSFFLNNCVASGDANLSLAASGFSAGKKILIFDNEPRNKEIVKMMQDAIKSNHIVVIWPSTMQGKDINEMILNGHSVDEIENIISSNSFKGLEAQAKFTFWKKV